MDAQTQTMIDNLEPKTGKSLQGWTALVVESGLTTHGKIRSMLKEHGLTHGYANLVAHLFLKDNEADEIDPIANQYAKKPAIRPIYDALIDQLSDLEFEIVPKKTAVALKRTRQFAYLQPSTKTRLDVGVQLKGHPGTPRLKPRSGMTSHVVALTSLDQIDAELLDWLRAAWEAC